MRWCAPRTSPSTSRSRRSRPPSRRTGRSPNPSHHLSGRPGRRDRGRCRDGAFTADGLPALHTARRLYHGPWPVRFAAPAGSLAADPGRGAAAARGPRPPRERVGVEHTLARIQQIQSPRARDKGVRKNTLDLRRHRRQSAAPGADDSGRVTFACSALSKAFPFPVAQGFDILAFEHSRITRCSEQDAYTAPDTGEPGGCWPRRRWRCGRRCRPR